MLRAACWLRCRSLGWVDSSKGVGSAGVTVAVGATDVATPGGAEPAPVGATEV